MQTKAIHHSRTGLVQANHLNVGALPAELEHHLVQSTSSSAGIYSNGDGKDLGNALQFKSEVNLFYRLGKSSSVGVGSHHISNAGLSSVNPGTNNFYLIFNRDF